MIDKNNPRGGVCILAIKTWQFLTEYEIKMNFRFKNTLNSHLQVVVECDC